MEMKDGNNMHDPNNGSYNPAVMNPAAGPMAPGYPGPGYPPANYPAPGYPAQGVPGPYGYAQLPQGQFQGPPGQPNYGPPGQPNYGPPGQPNYGPYGGGPPVQNQPMGPGAPSAWMPLPPAVPNCPPGLEYLSQIDQLLVHQQVELLEALIGYESNNKYEIKNSMGQRVYFAAEQNDCCTRNFCGASRPFTISIVDNTGREVIKLSRNLRCSSCCFPCCLQKLEVQAPPGTTVGYVVQNWHPCLPKFTIQNEKEEDVLKIKGPCVPCSCCSDVNFELHSLHDESAVVGRVSKQWSGAVKEYFTDADNFGVQFPMDLDVKTKAVILGACFLIDFMFFEKTDNKH